jgi:basic amino acid/polyamine antiporter, APA family
LKPTSDSAADSTDSIRPKLSLLDATCIMVGIIIGASIYESSDEIAEGASYGSLALVQWLRGADAPPLADATAAAVATAGLFAVWIIGGIVALVGALCYAELSTAFPHEGGNYAFLKQAFGSDVGFAFAWVEFWIVRPGNVGAVAFVFARYAATLLAPWLPGLEMPLGQLSLACAAIVGLAAVNFLGVRTGTVTQNALTACKVLGLLAIVATAFTLASGALPDIPPAKRPFQPDLALALIYVMFAYGGWSDMSYVAAEVHSPAKNISHSLLLGAGLVTAIYLLSTWAFLTALSLPGLRNSTAVAADTMAIRFGHVGVAGISLLICVSTLGAVNGMLFAGSRVFYALGKEDTTFAWLGAWSQRYGGPVRSLILQTLATLVLCVVGQSKDGFERLVVFTAPFFWGFLLLIGIGFLLLRARGRLGHSGYRVPLYPLPPLILCAACAWMLWKGAIYAWDNNGVGTYWAIGVLVGGIAVMFVRRWPWRGAAKS